MERLRIGQRVSLIGACVVFSMGVCCHSAYSSPTTVNQLPPGVPPRPGALPPPGSGDIPQPLVGGDAGAAPRPPSGRHDPTSGSRFATQNETVPIPYQPFSYPTTDGRPLRTVMPDRQANVNPNGVITNQQLETIQNRQYPWPTNYIMDAQDRKYIVSDGPGPIRRQYYRPWFLHERNNAPIPTVRILTRLLVKAGAVFATVLLAIAAFGVVSSHKDSGQRVVGTAGGLILLFMAYSIYKVVMINAFRFGADTDVVVSRLPANPGQALEPAVTPRNPPGVPPAGARRSNLRVQPFYRAP